MLLFSPLCLFVFLQYQNLKLKIMLNSYELQCKTELHTQIITELKRSYKVDSFIIKNFINYFDSDVKKLHSKKSIINFSYLIN